jgi:AcrR family transcriptional regulator
MAAKGRPRSDASRCAILEAALRLARTGGYSQLTIDGIAAEAGAGKQTIYRWWASKAAVVLEALQLNAHSEIELPDRGSLREDLAAFFKSTFAVSRRRPGIDSVLRAMMAEAQRDPEFLVAFREQVILPRREALASLIDRARARKEIRVDADEDLLVDLGFGVMWYRMLTEERSIGDHLAAQLAEVIAAAAQLPGV